MGNFSLMENFIFCAVLDTDKKDCKCSKNRTLLSTMKHLKTKVRLTYSFPMHPFSIP